MRHSNENQSHTASDANGWSRHRWTEQYPPSVAATDAVARRADTEPTALDPLYGTIDPDALNELFLPGIGRNHSDDVRVTFTYEGFLVTVEGDGWLTVSPTSERPVRSD